MKSDIGIFGLGVMGKNLSLNFEQNNYRVSVFNRMDKKEKHITRDFLETEASGKNIHPAYTIAEFAESLRKPRVILLMVRAGKPVDIILKKLLPHLEKDDIVIDGGNSHYQDTIRRVSELRHKHIDFIGMGISGGEEGARLGPSLMPGGLQDAYQKVEPMLTSIAAKTADGTPCCRWIGENGAGHFVKMVHNGIEYADMQIIAEICHMMYTILGMNAAEISRTFRTWNHGKLHGYLTEITADIFEAKDDDGTPLVEHILDTARQKGTGRWTVISALEIGVPIPVISEAVFRRSLSGLKSLRLELSTQYHNPANQPEVSLKTLEEAFYASRIMAHTEGFFLIQNSCEVFGWNINPVDVAKVWQAGCIIQSSLLRVISSAFEEQPAPGHLLLSPLISDTLNSLQKNWRKTVRQAVASGVPVSVIAAALSEFDTLRSKNLPANIIQAQRDFFGAHTYERTDKPRGTYFHTDWKTK